MGASLGVSEIAQEPIGMNGAPFAPKKTPSLPVPDDPNTILRRADEVARDKALVELAALVERAFQEASLHREKEIGPRLLECQRRKKGEYSATTLKAIQEMGGSKAYDNITETKTSAAAAWILDILLPLQSIFSLKPSAIPDLSSKLEAIIIERTVEGFREDRLRAREAGEEEPQSTKDDVFDFAVMHAEAAAKELRETALKRTKAHERLIQDQLEEGGFVHVLNEFVQNLVDYPYAVLKGPVIRKKRVMRYSEEEQKLVFDDKMVPEFEALDVFDVYFSPNATNPNQGYVVEIVHFDPAQLQLMRDEPGWIAENIDAVLLKHAEVNTKTREDQPERPNIPEHLELSDKDQTRDDFLGSSIRGKSFWGTVPTLQLKDMGVKLPEDSDITGFEEVAITMFGRYVVKVILNPDPLGHRPYYVTSFEKMPNSFIGKAICEKIKDTQDGQNGVYRALFNNLALASGPMVAVDMHSKSPSTDVRKLMPGMIFRFDGSKAQGRQPVTFFQPAINSAELISVMEFLEGKADNQTLIPRFVQGSQETSGAAETLGGLRILTSAGARGIKRVLGFMDQDILMPALTDLYTWNMIHIDDDSIKADSFVVPSGILAKLVEEQAVAGRQEFAALTQNDLDQLIMGIDGRAKLLRKILVDLGFENPDELIPTDEEMKERQEERAQAAAEEEAKAAIEQDTRQELAERSLAMKSAKAAQDER